MKIRLWLCLVGAGTLVASCRTIELPVPTIIAPVSVTTPAPERPVSVTQPLPLFVGDPYSLTIEPPTGVLTMPVVMYKISKMTVQTANLSPAQFQIYLGNPALMDTVRYKYSTVYNYDAASRLILPVLTTSPGQRVIGYHASAEPSDTVAVNRPGFISQRRSSSYGFQGATYLYDYDSDGFLKAERGYTINGCGYSILMELFSRHTIVNGNRTATVIWVKNGVFNPSPNGDIIINYEFDETKRNTIPGFDIPRVLSGCGGLFNDIGMPSDMLFGNPNRNLIKRLKFDAARQYSNSRTLAACDYRYTFDGLGRVKMVFINSGVMI